MGNSSSERQYYVEVMGGKRKGSSVDHKGDTVHIAISEKMLEDLESGPAYSLKEDLLMTSVKGPDGEPMDMTMFADRVRWDFIVQSLENDTNGGLLMPFSKNFLAPITEAQLEKMGFSEQEAKIYASKTLRDALIRSQDIVAITGDTSLGLKLAGRALLGGPSKSVVGYAAVKSCNSMLFLHRLQTKHNIKLGTGKAHGDLLALGEENGIFLTDTSSQTLKLS